MSKLKQQINEFIVENFMVEEDIESDDSFLDQGIIDSTGIFELTGWLESTFNIKIEQFEIIPENLDTIESLVNFLNTKGVADADT